MALQITYMTFFFHCQTAHILRTLPVLLGPNATGEKKKKHFSINSCLISLLVLDSYSQYTVGKISGFFFFPTSLPNTGGNALCVFPQKCTEDALLLTEGLDHSQ